MPDLHPTLAALAPLLGTWAGTGRGEYPTIESFRYREEVTFGHSGKPFLTYSQKTQAEDDGRPLHAETGYLRLPAPDRIELVLAHPTGITEISAGPILFDGSTMEIDLITSAIGLSASAKEVSAVARWVRIDGDELNYRVRMAAVAQPLQHHLAATLRRVPA
jgi:THAP4-like, heme-binding beta-barrel domain